MTTEGATTVPSPTRPRRRRWRLAAAAVLALALLASCAADADDGVTAQAADTQGAAQPEASRHAWEAVEAAFLDDDPSLIGLDEDNLVPVEVAEPARWVLEEQPEKGEPGGRIIIPAADVDAVFVGGVKPENLALGPGHMTRTAVPGQYGNSAIAGHRTTYGAWFNRIDLLEPGDEIFVETGIGTHTYAVVSTIIVHPRDTWVVQPRDGAWLTLISCHPKGSAAQRMIVFAKLVDGPNIDAVTEVFGTEYEPPEPPPDA
jgi:LPXTG-site transpeptidase (sortase) family protein